MPQDNPVAELAKVLSASGIVLSGNVEPSSVHGVDLDVLASKLIELCKDREGLKLVSAVEIGKLVDEIKVSKVPLPIEVIRSADFKPIAAELDANYRIRNSPIERAEGSTTDFVNYFRDRLARVRVILESHRNSGYNFVQSLEQLKGFAGGREVAVIGIVTTKTLTTKGNILLRIEDETAEANIMFFPNSTSEAGKSLFERAGSIINDEVIAIKGKMAMSGPFVYANDILLPDIPIKEKKQTEDDIAIAFMSDIHVGSKRFLEKSFLKMIDWLNGNVKTKYSALPGKIKYIVMAGDIADGIGIYPGQDRDLSILDIYAQYNALFKYIDAIPDYIHVFMLPGNHDAVQRAEPQPVLGDDIVKDFKRPNVHILTNPSYVTLHGLDVLTYHGTSLDSIISAVPGTSYAQPEKAMIEVLRRRHLSPVYGGNVIVPTRQDHLVIDKVPDILHMGHIHKNGIANYHGVEIVNSGTWQARTDFQIRQGHIPSPCIMPVYETKTNTFTQIDFSTAEE